MTGLAVRRLALVFCGLTALFIGLMAYRTELVRGSSAEEIAFQNGFAENFLPLVGHGPDERWDGCWLERVQSAVDLTSFSYVCPGEVTLDIDVAHAPRDIVATCPYVVTGHKESDSRFESLAQRLCEHLPALPGRDRCCAISRRESPDGQDPMTFRHDASGSLN